MLALHVSYSNRDSNEWVSLPPVPLTPVPAIASGFDYEQARVQEHLTFPNGETMEFGVAYAGVNHSVSVHVTGGGTETGQTTLLNFGGFKSKPSNYDPTAIFLSPAGLHVQIMVGPIPPVSP